MKPYRILDRDGILHGSVGVIMGLCYQPRMRAAPASKSIAPERLPAAKKRPIITRSEYGLTCLGESHFDASRPTRLIAGSAVSSRDRNQNGDAFVAAGMREMTFPTPLFFKHERPIGRVLYARAIGDKIHFQAELANVGSDFSDRVWNDIVDRRLDSVSVGASPGAKTTDGAVKDWGLREISVCLLGADDGASIDRCWERPPGNFLGRAPIKLHWQGPLCVWDAELAAENMTAPRESDPPPVKTESLMAIAASLSTQRRAELAALRAA